MVDMRRDRWKPKPIQRAPTREKSLRKELADWPEIVLDELKHAMLIHHFEQGIPVERLELFCRWEGLIFRPAAVQWRALFEQQKEDVQRHVREYVRMLRREMNVSPDKAAEMVRRAIRYAEYFPPLRSDDTATWHAWERLYGKQRKSETSANA